MTGYSVLFFATGALIIALSIPLICRWIRPNSLYGLRIPATLADDWVWYEANARSGKDLLTLGCVEVLAAIGLSQVPGISIDWYVMANAVLVGSGALITAVIGWRRATRLLASRRPR